MRARDGAGNGLGGGATSGSLVLPRSEGADDEGDESACALLSAAEIRLTAARPITTEASKTCFTAIFSVNVPMLPDAAASGAQRVQKSVAHSR